MRFQEYLDKHGISYTDAGKGIGVKPQSARRYATGERIPEEEVMLEIFKFTNSEVTPNDFYGITSSLQRKEVQ